LPRAKLLYSEFCTNAPLARQFQWDQARPQLARIHAPHKASGYIADVDFESTFDDDGTPDWIMLYKPGPRARAEYRAFAKRGGSLTCDDEPFNPDPLPQLAAPPSPLVAELVKRGVQPTIASQLAAHYPPEKIEHHIDEFDWKMTQPKPPKKPAGYLVTSIQRDYEADPAFVSKAQRRQQEDDRIAAARKAEQQQSEKTQAQDLGQRIKAYLNRLGKTERLALEAKVLAAASVANRAFYDNPGTLTRATVMLGMIREYLPGMPEFEQFTISASSG
jgi:hypothetical protein